MDSGIKKNYIFNVFNQVLTLVIPFITAPYLSRVLEADGIGLYSYYDSLVSYFVLFASLGLALYGQREVSYWQRDRKERSKAFWEVFILGLLSTSISFVAYGCFIAGRENKTLLLVLSLNIVSCSVDISWFFQGMENFKLVSIRNLVFKILNVAYVFIFVKNKMDLQMYALGVCGFSFLNGISLWFSLSKYVSFIPLKELRPFKRLPAVISLFVPTIAIQIYTVLDKTMIGVITNDAFQNGYYEQAVKIVRMVLALVTSLGTVVMSRTSLYYSNNETNKLKEVLLESYRFVWFLSIPLGFGLSIVSSNFIPWFYGPGYEDSIPLLQILSFLIIVIGVSNVTGIQYLIPVGKQWQYTLSVVTGACLNLALNSLLIPKYLAFGAAVASLAAEVSVSITQLLIVRKDLPIGRIVGSSWKYLVSGIIMFVVVRLEGTFFEPSAWNTAVMVFSGMTVYFLALLVLRDGFLKELFSKEKDCV